MKEKLLNKSDNVSKISERLTKKMKDDEEISEKEEKLIEKRIDKEKIIKGKSVNGRKTNMEYDEGKSLTLIFQIFLY